MNKYIKSNLFRYYGKCDLKTILICGFKEQDFLLVDIKAVSYKRKFQTTL